MNGLILATLILPTPDTDRSWEELLDGIADVTRMAEPYLRVQPTDTPEILARRKRLAQLIEYVERSRKVSKNRLKHQEFFNLCQVYRDVADGVCQLTYVPAERLACYMAMWSSAKKTAAYSEMMDREGLHTDPPASRNNGRAHLELFQAIVRRSCAPYFALAFLPLR